MASRGGNDLDMSLMSGDNPDGLSAMIDADGQSVTIEQPNGHTVKIKL